MKTPIFEYLDYRPLIKELSKEYGLTFKVLATSARIHTSYFSRVMQGRASFSHEQLFFIGKDLKLDEEQLSFLMLLGDYASSGNSEHKDFLFKKINKIQTEKRKILNKFETSIYELSAKEVELYYREAVTAKIHILLTIEKYQENPSLISKKIFISEKKLERELAKLQTLKIIENKKGKVNVLNYNVHLDESHEA